VTHITDTTPNPHISQLGEDEIEVTMDRDTGEYLYGTPTDVTTYLRAVAELIDLRSGPAEPQLGDVVVYSSDAHPLWDRESALTVVGINHAGLRLLVSSNGETVSWFVAAPGDLRVVRRAHYTEVPVPLTDTDRKGA
jgi:hypothetical protein